MGNAEEMSEQEEMRGDGKKKDRKGGEEAGKEKGKQREKAARK